MTASLLVVPPLGGPAKAVNTSNDSLLLLHFTNKHPGFTNTSSFWLKPVSGTLSVGAAVLSGEFLWLGLPGRRSEIGSHIQCFLEYLTISLE